VLHEDRIGSARRIVSNGNPGDRVGNVEVEPADERRVIRGLMNTFARPRHRAR